MDELLKRAQKELGLASVDLADIYAAALRRAYGDAVPDLIEALCSGRDAIAMEVHVEHICKSTPVVESVVMLAQRGAARKEAPLAAI